MRWLAVLFCLGSNSLLLAQSSTITGHVTDEATGETLVGAAVFESQLLRGTTCNQYGFYSLTLPADSAIVVYSYVGYSPRRVQLALRKDTVLDIKLQSRNVLDSVTIYASVLDPPDNTSISTVNMPIKMITDLPALMGEPDVLKSLQLLPGVKMGSEGSSGLYVRGGGPDQNLIILDGVPIYNASHVYGFFSAFNPDAINNVDLITGGFPARYGGRLSSIVDITMREGNRNKFQGQVTLGVITSRLVLEGPIAKKKGSFIVSARRSYLNLLRAPVVDKLTVGPGQNFYFYDFNAKVNYELNNKNRLYLSGYRGKDFSSLLDEQSYESGTERFESSSKSEQNWGNLIAAVRWNHIYSPKLFSNVTATYTKYQFEIDNETTQVRKSSGQETSRQFYEYIFQSGVRDLGARVDFDYVPGTVNRIRFGGTFTNHLFTPGVVAIHSSESTSGIAASPTKNYSNEMSLYVEDEVTVGRKLRINGGLHSAFFFTEGKLYPSLQPRLSASYTMSESWVVRAAYASMRQYVHLLSNSGLGLPTDLWTPTTAQIKPEASHQETVGISRIFGNRYKINLEGYYKTMTGLIEYSEGANYLTPSQSWEEKVESGHGKSYGGEVLFEKKFGSLTGWVGYTLSWTNRQFNNINGGRWFPYRYDRRHDLKAAMAFKFNKRFDFAADWIFSTGNAVTVPSAIYEGTVTTIFTDPYILHYAERNGFRMGNYHRLDVGMNFTIQKGSLEHKINFSIYNAYYRKNPFYLAFDYVGNNWVLRQVSLFPLLPSLSYTLKFGR